MTCRPLRVALIYGGFPPKPRGQEDGGADYVRNLAVHLGKLGCLVHVVTSAKGSACTREEEADVVVHEIINNWSARGWLSRPARVLKDVLHEIQPDIIHLVYPDPYLTYNRNEYSLPFLIPILSRAPLVSTFFAFAVKGSTLLTKAGLLWLFASSRVVNITNGELIALFNRRFPFWRHKVVFIPVGSNLQWRGENDHACILTELAQLHDSMVLAFVGFWGPDKGIETLLLALRRLRDNGRRVKLLFVGGRSPEHYSSYDHQILSQINKLGLAGEVVTTGYCNEAEVISYLSVADLCVLPFRKNVIGRSSLALAVSLRKPIITTDLGDGRGLLRHAENVWLVKPDDEIELAEAIDRLLEDKCLREHLSEQMGNIAIAMSWETIGQQWLETYARFIKNV